MEDDFDIGGAVDTILAPSRPRLKPAANEFDDLVDSVLDPDHAAKRTAEFAADAPPEPFAERAMRRVVPFGSAMGNVTADMAYRDAREKARRGVAETGDLRLIGEYEARQKEESERGIGGSVVDALLNVPAMVGEGVATGGIGLGGWSAKAVGSKVAQTALMPSMYLGHASERANARGGEFWSKENIAPAFLSGAVQNVILGAIPNWGQGIANPVKRLAARAGMNVFENAAGDAVLTAADEYVLPEAMQTETKWGLAGNILRREGDQALKRALVDVVTGAAFTMAHGNPRAARPDAPAAKPDVRGQVSETVNAYQKALESMAKKGAGRASSERALTQPHEVLRALFQDNPNAGRADALKAMDALPEGPLREWGQAVARTVPDRAKVADQAGPSQDGQDAPVVDQPPVRTALQPVLEPHVAAQEGEQQPTGRQDADGVAHDPTVAPDSATVKPPAEPARPEPPVPAARIAQDARAAEGGPTAADGAKVEPGATPERVEQLRAALEAVGWKSRGKKLGRLTPDEVVAEAKLLGIDGAVERPADAPSIVHVDNAQTERLGSAADAPRPDADEFAAAGLSKREADVVARRRQGESLEKIGKSLLITRERVRQIEAAAQKKLGVDQSVAKDHESEAAARALDMIERGKAVGLAELSGQFDPETGKKLPRAAKRKLTKVEKAHDALESLADKWLEEADGGQLTADRRTFFEGEAARLHREASGGPEEPSRQPTEVRGGPREGARPDPGRRGGDGYAEAVGSMLQDAAAQAKSYGLSLAGLRLNAGRGRQDSSSFRRFDEIAASMSAKYPELFKGHPDAGDRLYDLIVAGKPKPGEPFEAMDRQAAMRRPLDEPFRGGDADEGLEADIGTVPERDDKVDSGVFFKGNDPLHTPIPGTPDPAVRGVEGDHPVYARINDGLQRNPALTPEQRSSLGRATTRVLARMPEDARSALAGGMADTHFHGDLEAVAQDIVAATMANPKVPMERKGQLAEMARGWRDGSEPLPGGAYVGRLVIIDEGYVSAIDTRGEFGGKDWTAERLHAHEYAHAVGRATGIDTSPAWDAVHAKEFGTTKRPTFNSYAASDAREGFAEVMSYLWGTDGPTDVVARKMPETAKLLKDAGLWIDRKTTPIGRDGTKSFLQRVKDIFSRKVPLGEDGSHADLMLQQGQGADPEDFHYVQYTRDGMPFREWSPDAAAAKARVKELRGQGLKASSEYEGLARWFVRVSATEDGQPATWFEAFKSRGEAEEHARHARSEGAAADLMPGPPEADLMLQRPGDAGRDDERVTSTRKLTVDAEREGLGLPAIPAAAKRGAEHLWAYAQDQAARDPQAAGRLIDSLEQNPRAASDAERYQLLHERVSQGNRIERLARGLEAESADPADRVARAREYDEALLARDRLDKVLRSTGTEAGRGLAAIKAAAREDYSLARMLTDARVAKGEPLTAEETAKIKDLQAKIKELQEKLDAQGEGGIGGKDDFDGEQTKKDFREWLDRMKWLKTPLTQKVLRIAGELPNISRAILLGFDLPPLLRQGGMFTLSHPIKSVRAWLETSKAFASEEAAFRMMRQIERRPTYELAKRAGLELTSADGKLSEREEQFASKLIGKIPVLGPALGRLERWHTAYLNRARADLFDLMASTMGEREGQVTRDEAKVFANAANVLTGRGNMGSLQKHVDGLSKVFLAPRWVASRVQVLAGQPLYTSNKAARNVVARQYARAAVGIGVLYGVANLLGSETEKDPRSADFGKLKTGRTRIDPTAGLANPLTFASRVTSGSTKTIGGEVRPIRGGRKSKDNPGGIPYGADDAADVAARFLRSKLAPVPGAIVDWASGTNVVGEPTPPKQVAKNLATPIMVKDAQQIMTEEYGLPKKVAAYLVSLLGAGVQVHDRKPAPKPTR